MRKCKIIRNTGNYNQTFDNAVSRMLSPVVVMVTDESTNMQKLHLQFLTHKYFILTHYMYMLILSPITAIYK